MCQHTKQSIKNVKISAKLSKEIQWNKLCVDLIVPYKLSRKGREPLILKCVTMIDPVIELFEITQYNDKISIPIFEID